MVLSISVVIHKFPVALTVGAAFKSQNQDLKEISTITIFVSFIIASPIGMIIGISIKETASTSLTMPLLNALSGGTFVYLACCDLLIREFHQNKT
jgi:zinc transporter ZupT